MAKNDGSKVSKDEMKSVPPTKNQRTKAAREARAARTGKASCHGGVCDSCGQVSTSCTTHTAHDSCLGYAKDYDFKDFALNALAGEFPMLADGTIIKRPIPGKWIKQDELAQRRLERKAEAYRIAKNRVVMTSVVEQCEAEPTDDPSLGVNLVTKFVKLDVTNGLGEPIFYVGEKFRTEDEVNEYRIAYEQDAALGAVEAANDVHEQDVEALAA